MRVATEKCRSVLLCSLRSLAGCGQTVGADSLRRKMGPLFEVLVLGMGFPPFFAALSEAKQTHGVQGISPGAHQIALVIDIRVIDI